MFCCGGLILCMIVGANSVYNCHESNARDKLYIEPAYAMQFIPLGARIVAENAMHFIPLCAMIVTETIIATPAEFARGLVECTIGGRCGPKC